MQDLMYVRTFSKLLVTSFPFKKVNNRLATKVLMSNASLHNKNSADVRLIWHRHDLRLHDNDLYSNLFNGNTDEDVSCISLFIFDPQYFHPKPSCTKSTKDDTYNTVWCGPHAAQALIEAVTDLRDRIRSIGGELLVRSGDPAIIIPQIAGEIGATEVFFNEEPGTYENEISQRLRMHYAFNFGDQTSGFGKRSVKLVSKVGYTLYHPNDLPTDPNEWNRLAHPKNKHKKKNKEGKIGKSNGNSPPSKKTFNNDMLDLVDISPERFKGMNRIMGDFRKAVSSAAMVRRTLDAPAYLQKPHCFDVSTLTGGLGLIPTLEELTSDVLKTKSTILGLDTDIVHFVVQAAIEKRNKRSPEDDVYGERAALHRLSEFLLEGYACTAERSRADVSNNNSSRLSIHFALGTLSPRTAYREANYAGEGCEWLISHLEMRDFFLYTSFALGGRLYHQKGFPVSKKQVGIEWRSPQDNEERWRRWATGKTQLPLIDAGMLELMSTGYCSNRVRQNVASVLCKDLQIDWRAGAEWFQFLLEDHCVGANFGNWLYFSGVGPDPKNRHFRTVSQMKLYDKDGSYAKKWIPSLKNVTNIEALFRPWDFDVPGFQSPVVDPNSQYTWRDTNHLTSTGKLLEEMNEKN